MLAKAVAKDSGSRMLDIQASDVYDMYVGQGEKNVKVSMISKAKGYLLTKFSCRQYFPLQDSYHLV